MYLYMQSVNINRWLSIYYTVMSCKLTSVTVRIYNFIERFCFNGTKWSYWLFISKLIRCKTPTILQIWYNGDTHNQVITIDILHFNKYRFCIFHNKFLNNFTGKLPLSLNFNDTNYSLSVVIKHIIWNIIWYHLGERQYESFGNGC